MPEPTEDELKQAVFEYLSAAGDMSEISFSILRKALEAQFECDLGGSKHIIKTALHAFVDDLMGNKDKEGGDENIPEKKKKLGFAAQEVQLSNELSEFMGVEICGRTEVTKQIWVYIKANNLQNPSKKSEIICDDKLEKLLKKPKVNMFKMTGILCSMMKSTKDLTDHPEEKEGGGPPKKKVKKEVKEESKPTKSKITYTFDDDVYLDKLQLYIT
mmetsp:Transcript_8156/g.8173  ORF Transcript_8156/g.8173 Transcript_8156/m.8173 type:complete len:215 (+) Transcript_8156:66-710(+)